jgi:hypothetical protein
MFINTEADNLNSKSSWFLYYKLLTNVPSMGKKIVAVAVLDVTSVKAHNIAAVISTITNVGTLSSLASC